MAAHYRDRGPHCQKKSLHYNRFHRARRERKPPSLKLLLASTSLYRKRLLQRLQIPFTAQAPGVMECMREGENGEQRAQRLAREKAGAVAALQPGALVLGSDQVAVCGGDILDKPGTEARAISQLRQSSGQTVHFYTAIALQGPNSAPLEALVTTAVHFRPLTDAEIQDYVNREQPYDCAGSFRWESLGIALFERLESDDPTALEGLPLIATARLLKQAGLSVLGFNAQPDSSLPGTLP